MGFGASSPLGVSPFFGTPLPGLLVPSCSSTVMPVFPLSGLLPFGLPITSILSPSFLPSFLPSSLPFFLPSSEAISFFISSEIFCMAPVMPKKAFFFFFCSSVSLCAESTVTSINVGIEKNKIATSKIIIFFILCSLFKVEK